MSQVLSDSSLTTYASKKDLARIFNVSLTTIQRAMRKGLAEAAGASIEGQWRFDVAKAWEFWRQRGRQ